MMVDVYKRQRCIRMGHLLAGLDVIDGIGCRRMSSALVDRLIMETIQGRVCFNRIRRILRCCSILRPVSYTHLDVYKRQL